jgi:hypothetical protein
LVGEGDGCGLGDGEERLVGEGDGCGLGDAEGRLLGEGDGCGLGDGEECLVGEGDGYGLGEAQVPGAFRTIVPPTAFPMQVRCALAGMSRQTTGGPWWDGDVNDACGVGMTAILVCAGIAAGWIVYTNCRRDRACNCSCISTRRGKLTMCQ